MSISVVLNGETYTIPTTEEVGWGDSLTSFLAAIPDAIDAGGGGGGGITTVGAVGAGNADALSISGSTIQAHLATTAFPGVMSAEHYSTVESLSFLSVFPTNGVDDVADIQDRIDDAVAMGKDGIHFGRGTWTLDCQNISDNTGLQALIEVPSNFRITGEGPGRTVINIINATSGAGDWGVNCFGVTSESNVVIEGLNFVGENDPYTFVLNNQGSCIRVFTSSDVIIRNCRFESLFGFSAHDDGSERVHLLDCYFEDCANGPNMNGNRSIISRLSMLRSEGPECAGEYCTYSDWNIEEAQGVGASLGGNQGAEMPGTVVANIIIDGSTGSGMVINDGFSFSSVSNVTIRHCQESGLVVYQSGNPGAPTTRKIRFSNVLVDTNCVHPNIGTIVGADISGDGGHDFFNCSFTDDDEAGYRQIQAFSLNAPDCTVDGCRFQGHTATPTNKDASFGTNCTNLRLGLNNRFENGTQEFQAGCTIAASEILGIAATDRVIEQRVWNDSPGAGRRRFALQLDGKMTWGNGLDPEDTNLYRSAADTLKTDDSFIATGTVTGSNLSGTNTGDQTAGAGLTGTTTLNVGAHADGSIVVNADDIQVGVLATDAQHGNRGGGALHADVVAGGASGFMTGTQATKLAGIATGAAALTSSAPADLATSAAVGVATTAAHADHVHSTSMPTLTVDTTTLVVDATNDRVGIGIAAPTTDFNISKATAAAGSVQQIVRNTTANGLAQVLVQDDGSNIGGIEIIGSAFATTARPTTRGMLLLRGAANSQGTAIQAAATSTPIEFWTNNAGTHGKRAEITGAGAFNYGGVEVLSQTNTVVDITNKRFASASTTLLTGTGSGTGRVGATLSVITTQVGNVGSGEDDLMTFSLPASTLVVTGRGVRWKASGALANNANAKTIKLYFGASMLSAACATSIAANWFADVVVYRTGSSAQRYAVELRVVDTGTNAISNVFTAQGTLTQTETGAITIKATGTATSNDDIVQNTSLIEFV